MAVGPKVMRGGTKWWHWLLGVGTIAIGAYVGITYIPTLVSKIKGIFTKSAA